MNYETESSINNITQDLTETLADFLDSEPVVLNEAMGNIKDPKNREESVLHIKMAEAAMKAYVKYMQYPSKQ